MHSQDSIESEDELSANLPRDKGGATTKRLRVTNFGGLDSASKRRGSRGDIQPTVFKATGTRTQKFKPIKPLHVKRAVDGKLIFDSDRDGKPVVLRQEFEGSPKLVPNQTITANSSPHSWLEIDIGQIKELWHAATHSPYVRIERPRPHAGGATLWLELAGLEEVENLAMAAFREVVKEVPV